MIWKTLQKTDYYGEEPGGSLPLKDTLTNKLHSSKGWQEMERYMTNKLNSDFKPVLGH